RDDDQRQLVSELLGRGDGSFGPATTYGPHDDYFPSLALADFDGDGNTDVAGGHQVLLSNGDGTFRQPRELGIYSNFWTGADLNGDHKLDLGGTTYDGGGYVVSVLLGNGNGSFDTPQSFAAGLNPDIAKASDMNGDGVLDLVVKNYATDGTDGALTVL